MQAAGSTILGVRRLARGGWPLRTLLAGCLAATVAGVVSLAPSLAGASPATCQRMVGIDTQHSAGEGTGGVVFTVRTAGCATAGSVSYAVASGTAQAGIDFQAASGTLQWAAGDLSPRRITVTFLQDPLREADLETMSVSLREPSQGVSVVAATGQGRVIDDDAAEPRSAVDDSPCGHLTPNQLCVCLPQPMPEPISVDNIDGTDGGKDRCVIELSLSAPIPVPASVWWRTMDGTAVAGVDYVGVTDQRLEVPAGASTVELPVRLLHRPPGRPASWFAVHVVAVSPGVVADPVAVVTLAGS